MNLLSKFSPGRAAAQSPDSSDDQDTRIPGQSSEEPIPVPALILHCVFTWILIGATWGIKDPRNAYPLLVGKFPSSIPRNHNRLNSSYHVLILGNFRSV